MSPPLLGVVEEEEDKNDVALMASSASALDNLRQNLKGRNYIGFSDLSSADSSVLSAVSKEKESNLNLKATELRLGLPGSQSPERSPELGLMSSTKLDEMPLFPLHPSNDAPHSNGQKLVSSGNKRGFLDAMDGFPEGNFLLKQDKDTVLSPRPSSNMGLSGSANENHGGQLGKPKEVATPTVGKERPCAANETGRNQNGSASSSVPAAKAQVVGWPPVRSFRKNSLATTSKNAEEVDGKAGMGTLFVKVSMDGAPYLRKVDLRNYSGYQDLSSALEKMFSCFTIGQCGSHGSLGREMLSESKLKDLLHGSESVLTYEDKDGDWMLVGDVPWEMFIFTCKRLRIMKSSDAIGLAPRAVEKCKSGS